MGSESSPERMKELWQSQQTEGARMSVEQIRMSAGKFQRTVGWRNVREYVAAFAVSVFFAYQFVRTDDTLARIGFGLAIAGMAYMAWHLHAMGSSGRLPRDARMSSFIDFQRRELMRQRDLLRGVWRWYLGPLIPGLVVLMVGFGRANAHRLKHPELIIVAYSILVAALFIGIAKLNERAARRLQQQIERLDELSRD
jgi:hypothetical protein